MSKGEQGGTRSYVADRTTMLSMPSKEHSYTVAWISTRHGMVGLYAAWGERPFTAMRTVAGGREYVRQWDRTFTNRYLKTLATRFAQEVNDAD